MLGESAAEVELVDILHAQNTRLGSQPFGTGLL